MFFYVRCVSGTRYVSTFFSNIQGYNVQEFSTRQLLKHTKPTVTSDLLIEFSHSNALSNSSLSTKKKYKLSNNSKVSSGVGNLQYNSTKTNSLFDYCDKTNATNQNNNEQIFQEIDKIHHIDLIRDRLMYSHIPINYHHHKSISNQQKTNIYTNCIRNLIDIDTYTKDETKIMNFTASKNALNIRRNSTNASVMRKEERKPIDNLESIYDTLCLDLPNFFGKSMDYTIYHHNLEFVNNIRGITSVGLLHYVRQLAFLRILGHLKFAYVKLQILKITKHSEDNTIRVRWRIVGRSAMSVLFSIWDFKLWKMQEKINETETWYDGYSTFHVGDDGLVFKHIADKMMPDSHIDEKPKGPIPSELSFSKIELS